MNHIRVREGHVLVCHTTVDVRERVRDGLTGDPTLGCHDVHEASTPRKLRPGCFLRPKRCLRHRRYSKKSGRGGTFRLRSRW